jgi:hypothetical protein
MPILDNTIGCPFFEKGKSHRKSGTQNYSAIIRNKFLGE